MVELAYDQSRPGPRIRGALRQALHAWDGLIEHLPVAVYACDAAGAVVRCNRRARELSGAPGAGPGRRPAGGEAPLARVLRTGEPVHGIEDLLERPDGSRVSTTVDIDPIRDGRGRVIGALACLHDATPQKRAEEQARASERRLREILEALPAAIYTTDAEGRITFYNQAAVAFSGRVPALGSDEWCVSWRLYRPDGTPMRHDECPMAAALSEGRAVRGMEAVAERPDGARVPFMPYPTPLFDEDGRVVGAVNMLVDISERKSAEVQQKTLRDELNHRVKNTLATVQSLARQTLLRARSRRAFEERFQGRLMALSEGHDQLTRGNWEQAELREVLAAALASCLDEPSGRVEMEGEAVLLHPRAALTLVMVFHELTANAVKYGALARPRGRLAVRWTVAPEEDERMLAITWRERGGPAVRRPARPGFGTKLVERSIPAELGGTASLRFDPAGLCCEMRFPLARSGERQAARPQRAARLRRRR